MSMESEVAARKAARDLLDFLNSSTSIGRKEFAKEIVRGHRTLQDLAFRAMVQVFEEMAECEKKENYDLRNEYAVKQSAKIVRVLNGN